MIQRTGFLVNQEDWKKNSNKEKSLLNNINITKIKKENRATTIIQRQFREL